jgi:glycosyltransferase involved in cell wall biosynthesis
LSELGIEAKTSASPFALIDCDVLIQTNSCTMQRQALEEIQMTKKPFAVLGFHEDILQYYTPASGLCLFAMGCLGYGLETDNGMDYDIERLFEMPHIVNYYGEPPKRSTLYNLEYTKNAFLWIANSPTEARTMERDCPGCKTAVIPISPNFSHTEEPDDSFLKFTGLSKGSYILQVGRLEMRKNQLGSILATRNLDVPLVFISTVSPAYENNLLEAAAKWRKAPTLIISQSLKPHSQGSARIISMPADEKLPNSMLTSAYANAGLHLHPAFQELPGATYLEAAAIGTPTVASSWCTITDYFYDSKLGHSSLDGRIVYCEPHHLNDITQKIEENFGKTFLSLREHPVFKRTPLDTAKDLILAINSSLA